MRATAIRIARQAVGNGEEARSASEEAVPCWGVPHGGSPKR
jgi:hypothetical protein